MKLITVLPDPNLMKSIKDAITQPQNVTLALTAPTTIPKCDSTGYELYELYLKELMEAPTTQDGKPTSIQWDDDKIVARGLTYVGHRTLIVGVHADVGAFIIFEGSRDDFQNELRSLNLWFAKIRYHIHTTMPLLYEHDDASDMSPAETIESYSNRTSK